MTAPHEDQSAPSAPLPGVIGTTGLIDQLRGPASHVIVDVVDPGVGGATPIRQAMASVGAQPEKPSTPPALLLTAGIVVGATVVSAGVVNLTPAIAALVFAAAIIVWLRVTNHRARRTDENTRWASRSGQAFGAWEPGAPDGRRRLLLDHRGLAVVDLGVHREPMAVLLWKSIERLILVPGNERSTDPGLLVHRTDGRVAGFTTAFSLHELMPALDDVGLPTDIEQAMAGATSVRRNAKPLPPTPPAPPADPWANVAPAPTPGALATSVGAEPFEAPVFEAAPFEAVPFERALHDAGPPAGAVVDAPTSEAAPGPLFTPETPEPTPAPPRSLFPPTPAAPAAPSAPFDASPPPPPPPPPPPAPPVSAAPVTTDDPWATAPMPAGFESPTVPDPLDAPSGRPPVHAHEPLDGPVGPPSMAPAVDLWGDPPASATPAAHPAQDPWDTPAFDARPPTDDPWATVPPVASTIDAPHDSLPASFPAPPSTLADALGTTAPAADAVAPAPPFPTSAPDTAPHAVAPPPPPPPPPPAGWAPPGEPGALFEAHGTSTETSPPAEPPDALWR